MTVPKIAPGPRGEQGKTGESGGQGEQGKTGRSGGQGEQGDIGEDGHEGLRGERGDEGKQGLQGVIGGWSDAAMMFLIAALTVVFGFLFARAAIVQHELEQAAYERCQFLTVTRMGYNAYLRELTAVVRDHPEVPGNTDLARIYSGGALDLPDCGQDPSK